MTTIKSIQDSIDLKADAYATNQLETLSAVFKQYLVNNIDPAIYVDLEIHKDLLLNRLFDATSPVHAKLHRAFYNQERTRLIIIALTKLS